MSKLTVPMINFFPEDMLADALISYLGKNDHPHLSLETIAMDLGILNYEKLRSVLDVLVKEGLVVGGMNTLGNFDDDNYSIILYAGSGYRLSDKLI